MAFDQSTSASAAFVYIFAAIIIALTAYGGAQTIRFFNRGDISGRFPLLLLANALAILVFAVFSIIAVATDFDEHAINVLLLSTCAISFTVQLLRAIRLLFTIEVRYFISKQFANQFANQFLLGEGDDMLDDMVDERASYHSEDSEDSNSDNDMDYIEDEDEYDGEDDFYDGDYYETGSLHYSASYHDYLEADKTFGNDVEPSSSSEEEEEEEVLVQQPGQDGDKDALTENSSLFSTQSSVSQDLDDEEDLSNALGRWIFEHKSLASSSFMTGLAVFIYCKFVLLLTLFTMTCGLNWAWILWIVVLTFAVISCALTVASLKMVRIRAYYIWERQKADHDAKYYNKEVSQHEEKQLAEAEEDAAQAKKDAPSKNSSKNSNKDDTFLSATGRSKITSGQGPSGAKSRTGRAESESSRHKGSTMASKAATSKRQNNEKQTQQQAIFNASDSTGAVSIFGTTIVQQTTKDGRAITKDKPQWQKKKAQEKKKPMTSTNANTTTTTTTTTPAQHSESSVNKSSQQHSANQLQVQEEVAPENIPALPPAPPTTIFTPTHDPSGQMMELLTCALGTGLLYAVALLLAIIYAAQNEVVAPYTYFVITPTQTSPTFTRGILILLLMSNIIVVYTSLVHIVVNETVRGVITKIIGQQEQDKVDDDITKQFDTLKKILDQPDSRDEFRRFLDGEFSAENLLFWNAIEEYRARPVAHFQSRGDTISSAKYIFSTYLAPGGVYEVNISSQCREKISTRLKGLLEEDPINKVRMMETNEIEDAYDDYCRTQGLYHTYFCTDETGGVRKRDFGNPEEEEEKPKSKRALASAVAHTYCDQINRERQVGDFAKEKPYPVTVFEQYTFVQIGDIYQSISNIIAERMKADGHQHQKRDEPNSKTKPTGGDQDPGADHRRRQVNVVMDKDGPNPPPARLPSIATRHESAPLALTNAKDLDATISMLHKKGPNGAAILTYNKNAKSHAVVQHQQDHVHESDYSAEDSADDVKIEANELSFTRNANVDDEDDKEREEEDEEEQEEDYADKIQPNWTIYDLIRHKFDQYERYNGKNPNILMYDHGNGQHKPYPPPGEVRRRRRQAKGQDANGNVELNNGNRLHYALMSYEWKVEAARRRLKQYTDIVDELIVVFDAAQLEIFKLMERDSFARFLKSAEFQAFLNRRQNAASEAQEPKAWV